MFNKISAVNELVTRHTHDSGRKILVFVMGQSLFLFLFSFFNQTIQFYNQLM